MQRLKSKKWTQYRVIYIHPYYKVGKQLTLLPLLYGPSLHVNEAIKKTSHANEVNSK